MATIKRFHVKTASINFDVRIWQPSASTDLYADLTDSRSGAQECVGPFSQPHPLDLLAGDLVYQNALSGTLRLLEERGHRVDAVLPVVSEDRCRN